MMPSSEWTRMAVASGIAVGAMSFLAIDAGVDLNSSGIAKHLEAAQASIMNVAASQHQLAFAVRSLAGGSDQNGHSADRPCFQDYEHGSKPAGIDRGV
ncbi:bsl4437 [Bradyrhizobium diazoefficiens USDA 110]|uniref:Bsl4437 protein n=3 Tax=Bradyrhizobium diazoefficiens TaxID=1355477 RepID=Q89LV6_BRADU|nr:hypothetical protein BJA5080_04254 [Bradyrhizobium diazoefficiens SEMIA 5080]PDT58783.1 hypothetical protein CO678_26540 [Bradyrhizobium diazoefficiens]QBP23206.1 hypothetical protein Bdiaspc4_23105 [Bradyrhizobium diazoefficiens]BAC49702.1 bsl4437 [Bradyrhizobium diazoefficiens USDA 110]